MNFDRDSLSEILKMDDRQLSELLKNLAAKSGVDTSNLKLDSEGLAGLRRALSLATDEEIAALVGRLGGDKNG